MGSRLVKVRLDKDRIRKAQALREQGLTLSDLVRGANDERFAGLRKYIAPPDVRAIVQEILRRYPDPVDTPPRGCDLGDRRAARAAILSKLRSSQ